MTAVLFVIAAAAGACTRHAVNRLDHGWVGTLAVNVVGSFVLGALVANDPSAGTLTVLGTGFCGSLTTFSTFSLDATDGTRRHRLTVVVATLALTLAAAAAGYATTS